MSHLLLGSASYRRSDRIPGKAVHQDVVVWLPVVAHDPEYFHFDAEKPPRRGSKADINFASRGVRIRLLKRMAPGVPLSGDYRQVTHDQFDCLGLGMRPNPFGRA